MKKISRHIKRIITGLLAVVLAITALGPLSIFVSANYKSLQYVEEIKENKTNTGADFSISEIVPDSSESTMGYYVSNGLPIDKFINVAVQQGYNSANRQTAINNIYNGKLSDIIGTDDSYPVTKNTTGYVEYVPWAKNVSKDLNMLTSIAEEKYDNVENKFRAPTNNEIADYQSHGVYVLPTEYFNMNKWATNSATQNSMTNGLYVETDNNSYITLKNDTNVLSALTTLLEKPHTGYSESSTTFNNYYNIAVTPGETYSFSFDFTSSYAGNNGTDGQVTLYTYGSNGNFVYSSNTWTRTYTNQNGNSSAVNTTTTSKRYIFTAPTDSIGTNGIWDNNQGHYEYTFTVPSNVYYLQVSFGTWYQGINYDADGSITFSNIHLRNVKEVPDMVQEIKAFEPAAVVSEDTENDYYYAVKYTPVTSTDEFAESSIIYEQIWDSDGEQFFYTVINTDGTEAKVPAYQVFFNVNEISDDIEYSETKLKAGGYGKLSIDESASVVVTEQADAQHFYHAVPVYNTAGDLSFINVSSDTTGYYSGNNSYFITDSVNYSYVGSGGDYVYDNSITATDTVTIYTDKFYYDTGLTCNEWFKYKVLDRYDGDGYDFLTTLNSCTPQDITDNEDQYLITLKTKDLIVLSAGTQVNYSSFVSDISSEMRKAILECAGSEYNIPIIVDVQILNMVEEDSELAKLVNSLIDRTTEEYNVNVKNGGVAQNVYVFNSADIGSNSIATNRFNEAILKKKDTSSPYYDVYSEIYDENVYRNLDSYTYESKELPLLVSEATCIRCILNYAGRRVKNVKKEVRVLDIEPYLSVDHRTAVLNDTVYAYASKKYSEIECLKASDVISWLPAGTFTDKSGNYITEDSDEEKIAKYINITTMSVAEFIGHNEDLIGNYDLIYFGASLENFNKSNDINNAKTTHYNDTKMDGLIYSGMGDNYTIGNNANVIDGDTLLGLNDEDYTASITLLNTKLRYMYSGEKSTVKTSGNDITDTAEKKLNDYAKAGLPIVIANELTTSAEGTGVDGGKYVYDEEGNAKLQVNYSVSLETKTQYRDDDNGYRYFTYYLAKLNGNLPTGVSVLFKWYYVPSGTTLTDGNFKKEEVGAECISEVTATNIFGKGTGKLEEPVHAVNVTVEENVHNWYSTIGDIDQNFDYKDWNDDKTKDKITGLTIQDSSGQAYQKPGTYFYCEATLVVDSKYADDPILSSYNGSIWRSDIVQAVKETKTLQIKLEYNTDKSTSITITPNPYYQDSISDNFSFWWKKYSWEKKLWWYEWTDYEDDDVHRIDFEDVWQASLEKTEETLEDGKTVFTKKDIDINYTNSKGITIKTVRNSNGFTMYGYDDDDGNKLVQTYESVGNKDKDSSGNLTNPGYLKMTSYCAHSTNYVGDKSKEGNQALSVEMRIKGMGDGIQVNTSKTCGYSIDLDKDEQMGDAHYYGRKKDNSTAGTYTWDYQNLSLKHTNLTVTNKPILVSTEQSSISTIAVDNTTKIYKFLSSVYDTVTNEDGSYVERSDGAVLKRNGNVFNEVQFKHAKDTSEIKQQMYNYLYTVYSPELRLINNSVVSYPDVLTGTTLSGEFIIYNDIDTNETDTYSVELYIDQNHDAKFSDTEKLELTTLTEFDNNANANNLKSSTTDGTTQLHEYKFTKELTENYMGLVSWKLKITRVGNNAISDSYNGYSYIQTSTPKTIHAIQVLPADWWSAGHDGSTDGYITTYGEWTPNTKLDSATYTGGSLKDAYEQERANEIQGNAYLGSVFLGDNGKTKIVQKNSNGEYEVVYADAFYSLITAKDSILDRTVYYEDTGTKDTDYRTHVVFWVRPQGEKTARIGEDGTIEKDKKGNIVYEYEKCDYEVDIALTDITELNDLYSNDNCSFLDSYDMLILGFGDSYGKCETQSPWAQFYDLKLPGRATLGFNIGSALAVKKFIEEDKPVLFCHDTTNTNNNYISYFAQSMLSYVSTGVNKLLNKVQELVEGFKKWLDSDYVPKDTNTLKTSIQQSKVKDGYYNNILLRDSLNLDRYGITYSIRQTIGEENIKADMRNNTWSDGYKYNGIPYYERSSTSVNAMKAKNFSIVYKSTKDGDYIVSSKGANGVKYVNYDSNGEPTVDKTQLNQNDIKSAQGFTTWTIVRYRASGVSQLLPAGITESYNDGIILNTNKIQQVNKGQITTYPYDINTAEFGGATGNTDENSNSYGKITIKATHEQVYQVNTNGDDTTVWYTLAGSDDEFTKVDKDGNVEGDLLYFDDYDTISKDVANSYYIFTSGNITYTGAGHSNIFSEEEAKLFLNTLVASYRLPGEKPDIDFFNENEEKSNYMLLTADNEEVLNKDRKVNKEVSIKNGIASIKIDDINSKKTGLAIKFFIKDESNNYVSYDNIELHEKKDCSDSAVGYNKVKDGTIYYFKVPEDIIEKLSDTTAEDYDGSFVLYAQAVATVPVSGKNTDYASSMKYIQFRRLDLFNLG